MQRRSVNPCLLVGLLLLLLLELTCCRSLVIPKRDEAEPVHHRFRLGDLMLQITCENEEGGPNYKFWPQNASVDTYELEFKGLFEATYDSVAGKWIHESSSSSSSDDGSPILWHCENNVTIDNRDETMVLNITASSNQLPQPFDVLAFRSHVPMPQTKDTRTRFEVIISNYHWRGTPATTGLVLAFEFKPDDVDNDRDAEPHPTSVPDGHGFRYGGVYFNITPDVSGLVNRSQKYVMEILKHDDHTIWIIYHHFDGKNGLLHNLTFGVDGPIPPVSRHDDDDSDDHDSDEKNEQRFALLITGGAVTTLLGCIALLVFGLVSLNLGRRFIRRGPYQSINEVPITTTTKPLEEQQQWAEQQPLMHQKNGETIELLNKV